MENSSKKNKMIENNTKKIKIFFVSLLLFLFVLTLVSAATPDTYKPYLHKPSIGSYPKLNLYGNYQTQLFPGSAVYSYNIVVPPGIGSLSPELSVSYNSRSALQIGDLGFGWSISSNYIIRNINYTVNNTNDDYFMINLNGYSDKIFLKNGNYSTQINNYLKIENKTSGSNSYWVVTTKDGTKYNFGLTTNSVLPSNSSNYTLKWFLSSIQEIHGNVINYSYSRNPYVDDKGAMYLTNITYNNDQLRRIVFRYENSTRPDKRIIYDQGDKFLESRRLIGVEVYFTNSLVRKYSFAYKDLNSEKTLSSLANISYIGSDNSSVLNTVQFEYYDSQPGFINSSSWLVPEEFSSITSYSADLGIRLVDVNNDGFMDLVKSNGTLNYTKLNDKNSTWTDTSLFKVPEQIVNSSNDYQGVLFLDVNGDGLSDLIKSMAGIRKVYLNNRTNWVLSNWTIPVDFYNATGGDEGVRLLDLNGDGLIDILQAKAPTSIRLEWINNGTGWTNTSLWVSPDYFVDSGGKDTGLREIDLNGDGLTDLIKGGEPGAAWLNNGTGFVNETLYAPSLNFTDANNPDLGIRFMDINGDNLPDILQNFFSNVTNTLLNQTCYNLTNSTQNCTYYTYNVTNYTNIKINSGTGWVYSSFWQSPEAFTYNGYNTGRRIGDINGDGYSDIIVGYRNNTFDRKTYIRNATSAFILKKIINEYGGITQLTYNQSTLSNNNQNLGFNLWVISKVNLNNSMNGSLRVLANTSYTYAGGKFDYKNLEFLGFNLVNETLPDNTLIMHSFYQDSVLKGVEYSTKIYDKNNKHYKDNLKGYTNSSDNRIYLNYSTDYNYEGSPNAIISNTTYTYDNYGNVISINNSGNVQVSGDEKYETYGYVYNLTSYLVSKVSNYTLYNSSGSIAKRTWYYYDGLSSGAIKGDLTNVTSYNDHGANPSQVYYYDAYGNVIREIDANGNAVNYTYDPETNTLVIKKVNAFGHIFSYQYDKSTGNILSETSNGISKNYTYDIFGRNTKIISPLDSDTYPTIRTTYVLDGSAPEKIIVETKNNNTDYSETIYFYDGFSNPVQIKLEYDNNTQIVKDFIYDGKFRIIEEKNPFFGMYSSNLDSHLGDYSTKYLYDSLDRIVNQTNANNNSILINFTNNNAISTNENGIKKEYLNDIYGRIINVYEHNKNSSGADEIYNSSYYYDASDNLIKVTDSLNNSLLYEYDSLGRKISFDDPNMNKWTYSYDLNGNLINQTDGRNITTFLTYDKLNRLFLKVAGNTNVSFVYDIQYNGTLTNITLNSAYFKPVYYRYIYDSKLRIINNELSIHIDQNHPSGRESINTSTSYDSQDRILSIYLPNNTINYEYNSIGKLRKVQGFLDSINYNAFGKMANKTYSNNIVTTIDYDNLARISKLQSGFIQNLSYAYDAVGNVKQINDSKNNKVYSMTYDDLDRLVKTIIYNFNTYEHEKYTYIYNKIGSLLFSTNDVLATNYTYNSSMAHAPMNIIRTNRSDPRINISLVDPIGSKNVTKNSLFNFTIQVCCRNNDCWGINISLDPEENLSIPENNFGINDSVNNDTVPVTSSHITHSYSPNSETSCKEGVCNSLYYFETKFVYEDGSWKDVKEARSLKGVWGVNIKEDPNFPVEIIDYNYTTITLNLSVSKGKLNQDIPLKVYNKFNNSEMPKDSLGQIVNKDAYFKMSNLEESQIAILDLSDTVENLLNQEIKWGDHSTLITIYDNKSIITDDTYIKDGISYHDINYGSGVRLYVRNSTASNEEVLIRFDTSQIPRQALVDDARLYFYIETNGLGTGDTYNVSVHSIYHSFIWNESTITWDTKPQIGTDYNASYLDKTNINDTDHSIYVSWNVTQAIKNKQGNESFYIKAIENEGGSDTQEVVFNSKEWPGVQKNYLNVTYRLKNLVSTTVGETPFYTSISNPYLVDLEKDVCQNVTWNVNATGNQGNYLFFAYANKTSNVNIGAYTDLVQINIV